MRVLVVTIGLSREAGGLFHSVRRLAQCTAVQGVDVRVYGYWDRHTEDDLAVWAPLKPVACRCGFPAFLGYSRQLVDGLEKDAVPGSVMHVHGLWTARSWTCASVARRHSVPRVVSPRGMLDAWALRNAACKKRFARWLYEDASLRSAACLHALCAAELAQLRDFGIKNPVAVIPNGVDRPPHGSLRQGTPGTGKRAMLFLSRIHPKKGLVNLIRAWGKVQKSVVSGQWSDSWVLIIAGPEEGGHGDQVRCEISRLGLERNVQLVGPLYGAAKDRWLRAASGFVLPSYSEGLPMALLEAMAYGLPVVMTRFCNVPEAAACGAAVVAEPEPDSLAEALSRIMGMSDEHRVLMGDNGRRLVAERYGWPALTGQMISVYRWLLGEQSQPACVVRE